MHNQSYSPRTAMAKPVNGLSNGYGNGMSNGVKSQNASIMSTQRKQCSAQTFDNLAKSIITGSETRRTVTSYSSGSYIQVFHCPFRYSSHCP